jgi:hypothetical protein
MAEIAVVYGVVLVVLGIGGYTGTGGASLTALIPVAFGVPVLALGLLARARPALRMHAMHGAVGLGLLAFLGTARALARVPALAAGRPVDRPVAVALQAVMAVVSLVFVALCVKSFVDARRAGKP